MSAATWNDRPVPELVKRVADAICGASAAWLPVPANGMAYDDMARAALAAVLSDLQGDAEDNLYAWRARVSLAVTDD